MTRNQVNRLSSTSNTFWSWLFPTTYLLHIAEEYWGGEGYSAYLLRLRGIQLSPMRFVMVQAVGLALMITGIVLARLHRFPGQLSVVLGAVVLVNGLTHSFLSLVYAVYVPGLYTSILLWIPLGVVTLARFSGTMRKSRFWLCVALGVGINCVIELVTSRAGQVFEVTWVLSRALVR
jgi:hypothetical protein